MLMMVEAKIGVSYTAALERLCCPSLQQEEARTMHEVGGC